MAALRILCWALIFILRLRFPPSSSIATTCVIVSAMFMYDGVTVTVSRDILTNNLCKRLLNISILMQFTLMLA